MREQLVAWAEDCRLEGEVDLGEGRLSDIVNDREIVVFHGARLVALADGHEVRIDEVEVARRELSLVEVAGRRGDPQRRLRTVPEHVQLDVGPFAISGYIHRSPAAPQLNALGRWSRFLPVTDALVEIEGSAAGAVERDVLLVNRDRIRSYEVLPDAGPAWTPVPPNAVAADEGVPGDAVLAAEAVEPTPGVAPTA